jgi:hypothetical protein
MVAIGLVAMYAILNAGSPHSLLRHFFADPISDVYIAALSSFTVFVLGFIVFFNRDREGFRNLLEMNSEKIRQLKKEGQSNEAIAESLLAAMGSYGGYKHNMAKKKLMLYLSESE